MRKYLTEIAIFAIVLLMVSCDCNNKPKTGTPPAVVVSEYTENKYSVEIIDGCEYLVRRYSDRDKHGYGFMAHKGNCRFCKERRHQEIIDAIRDEQDPFNR